MSSREQFFNEYGIQLTRSKHVEIVLLLLCLEIVLAFSAIGFIQIPPISLTTLSILVIVAGMYFGPVEAVMVSIVFGCASMWKASLTSDAVGDVIFSPVLSGKPFESIVMALLTRVIFALIAGYLFRWYFSKERKHRKLGIAVISVVSTLVHAGLVYICMDIFFSASEVRTSNSFDQVMWLNNIILYGITVLVVLGADMLLGNRVVRRFLRVTTSGSVKLSKTQKEISVILTVGILVLSLLICIHFMSRIAGYFSGHEKYVEEQDVVWTYSMLFQFGVGFMATFGIIALLFRWIQEFFYALTIEADRKAKENAELANRSKSSFLFNMSHDIRTPMNAISGFTNMAIKHIDDKDKVLDCLEKSQKAGNMLLSLINNVLEVSRIEAGHATLEQKPGDVYYSFTNIENTLQELASTKDIKLSFEFGDITDRYVYVDISRCMRIFVNVITNAIKYTNEGGYVKVRCDQVSQAADGWARYQYVIADNGIGMSEEFQTHIFEQFAREETATVSGVQGSGLGMSVVKTFVDLLGGSVEVSSKQGFGTTIAIILPFKIQDGTDYTDPVTGEVVSTDLAETEERRLNQIKKNMAGKKVLLVEDNELNREIAVELLEDEGLIVEEADDGVTAVDAIEKKGPEYYDFILMDIQMPKMNGYDATRTIRAAYPDRHIPIIALSANAFSEDIEASMAAGMDAHVAKPINARVLYSVLGECVNSVD